MHNIKIIVAEDNPLHSSRMEMILEELGYDLAGLYTSAEETLRMFAALKPDLVILDIELEGNRDGVDIAHKINSVRPTPIIFATSFEDKETINRALKENPYAYLVKPVEKGSLQAAIELAVYKFSKADEAESNNFAGWPDDILLNDFFFVKAGDKLIKLSVNDILWIELAEERYCEIVTAQRRYHLRTSLKNLEDKLNPKLFFRTHRTCIVNLMAIESINDADASITISGQEVPLGKAFKSALLGKLKTLQ